MNFSEFTILIVDNLPSNLAIIVECLESVGFRVIISQDGESALERAKFVVPDLILLDILMPGIDGFETCRRLKSEALTQPIPVIFMTCLDNPEDKVKGFGVGG